MLAPGNTSPCHHSLHLFAKRRESQHAGIAQQLSVRALSLYHQDYTAELKIMIFRSRSNERPIVNRIWNELAAHSEDGRYTMMRRGRP